MERMSARQFRKRTRARRSKYNNKRVKLDGHTFDSRAEARYYSELKLRLKAGEIKDFDLQPRFRLLESFEDRYGNKHRPIDYVADFQIMHNDNRIEIVDVKGKITDVFRIKEKMFCKKYPYRLTLVKWENGGFVGV